MTNWTPPIEEPSYRHPDMGTPGVVWTGDVGDVSYYMRDDRGKVECDYIMHDEMDADWGDVSTVMNSAIEWRTAAQLASLCAVYKADRKKEYRDSINKPDKQMEYAMPNADWSKADSSVAAKLDRYCPECHRCLTQENRLYRCDPCKLSWVQAFLNVHTDQPRYPKPEGAERFVGYWVSNSDVPMDVWWSSIAVHVSRQDDTNSIDHADANPYWDSPRNFCRAAGLSCEPAKEEPRFTPMSPQTKEEYVASQLAALAALRASQEPVRLAMLDISNGLEKISDNRNWSLNCEYAQKWLDRHAAAIASVQPGADKEPAAPRTTSGHSLCHDCGFEGDHNYRECVSRLTGQRDEASKRLTELEAELKKLKVVPGKLLGSFDTTLGEASQAVRDVVRVFMDDRDEARKEVDRLKADSAKPIPLAAALRRVRLASTKCPTYPISGTAVGWYFVDGDTVNLSGCTSVTDEEAAAILEPPEPGNESRLPDAADLRRVGMDDIGEAFAAVENAAGEPHLLDDADMNRIREVFTAAGDAASESCKPVHGGVAGEPYPEKVDNQLSKPSSLQAEWKAFESIVNDGVHRWDYDTRIVAGGVLRLFAAMMVERDRPEPETIKQLKIDPYHPSVNEFKKAILAHIDGGK